MYLMNVSRPQFPTRPQWWFVSLGIIILSYSVAIYITITIYTNSNPVKAEKL